MQDRFVLVGLDYGGTAIKAIAIDEMGTVIAKATISRTTIASMSFSFSGHLFEGLCSPDSLVDAGVTLLQEIRREIGPTPMSVAISATGTALVVVDSTNRAIVPCVNHWGVLADELDDAIPLDPDTYARISGFPKKYHPPIFQLAWMAQQDTMFRRQVHRIMSISDYVASRLCGVFATEPSTAAASGGWDHDKQAWSTTILEAASLSREWFLNPVSSGSCLGQADSGFHLGQTIVTTGGHDYLCAGLSANTLNVHDCLNVLGTWEMVARFEPVEHWSTISKRDTGPLLHDRHVIPGMITSTLESWSAGQLEWIKKLLRITGEHRLPNEEEVGMQAIHGRYFKPFLGPQLFPWTCHDAALVGLDSNVGSNEVLRMVMEALAYIGARMIEQLDVITGIPSTRIIVGGGSSRNRLLIQIKADMLNRSIFVHKQADLSTIGAALLSGIGVGLYKGYQEAAMVLCDQVEEVVPDTERHFKYRELFDSFQWD
ncbi:FGGY family carbohydrate kinase [Alicyclobacillus fodiniaquatilis]|uniref:FGGY family carbohydrate kinase n=1 Tax=Alicyclobacillus fodiniaquatilis TaxID=1661150 RepID=A0ABW4JHM7_9BACL